MVSTQVEVSKLFEKIGRMYMQILNNNEELLAIRQQNGELSRVAGEALRALEMLGRKDLADKIMRGDNWDAVFVGGDTLDKNDSASTPESRPS